MAPEDDARLRELMQGYQQGRLDAFEDLYVCLSRPIRASVLARVREPGRAEDLVQETFLQIHRARHTYDPAYPVMPWVAAIARHVVLMDRRTTSRRPQYAPADAAPEPAVAADADRLADRVVLDTALGELAPSRREAVLLHHVWGWSFREIGGRLGIAETAAKLRSSRGIAQLRALVTGRTGGHGGGESYDR